MRKWYEDWGVWLISVIALIGFGILIGWDITELQRASSAFTAIGTLMLGVAALLAIPQWKRQEQKRFQASIASEMHAPLAEVRHKLVTPVYLYQGAVSLAELSETADSEESQQQFADLREALVEELRPLSRVLNSAIIPRSALLGLQFSEYSRGYAHELAMLLSSPDWNKNGFKQMNKVVDGLEELIGRLESIVLFMD
ncbi:hypothetical protein J6I75_06215 [Pseudidiomarina sp. 1APP75-27a]|uniref:hypothetical protein n=1 Tax=Pseudidiomarina terrestris TaxID=2820060 RepID=UPI002B05AE61|nr:hypothetical protein [Pseudidiomarina sp. 1APP75-27a]MEA3587942.1 hypothetical protein [Pseudidiomarina sp. 1APP75-27a]